MGELANKIYEFSCNEKVNEIIKYKNKANIWRIIEYGKNPMRRDTRECLDGF